MDARDPGGWWGDAHDVNGSPAAVYSIVLRTTGEILRPGAARDEARLLRHMITLVNTDGGFYKYVGSPSSAAITNVALVALRMAMGEARSRHWPAAWLARNDALDGDLARAISAAVDRAKAFLRAGPHPTPPAFEWDHKPLAALLAARVDQRIYYPPVPFLDPEMGATVEAVPWLKHQLHTLLRHCLPAASILYRRVRTRNHLSRHAHRLLEQFEVFRAHQERAIQGLAAQIRAAQNENGGWFYNVFYTMLNVMALSEAGADLDDPAVRRGFAYLRSNMVPAADGGAFLSLMNTDIWNTCLAVSSYLDIAGHTAMDDGVRPAIEFLLRWQSDNGGFAWASASRNIPDNDTTGFVTLVLAQAGRTARGALMASVARALARGRTFLLANQDGRGGFSVFKSTVAPSRPGSQPLLGQCLFDVATPDVTSRIVMGLCRLGLTTADDPIRRAVAFLLRTQCTNGAWWSRWWAAYVPGTAFAIFALAEIGRGQGRSDPLVGRAHDAARRGAGFLLACQNHDGGWGETVQADSNIRHAGVGSSTPQYTALTVAALLRAGRPAEDPAVRRGIEYLLTTMRTDGGYPDEPATFTFAAGTFYYAYSFHSCVLPLQAFTEYLKAGATRAA